MRGPIFQVIDEKKQDSNVHTPILQNGKASRLAKEGDLLRLKSLGLSEEDIKKIV